MSIITYKEVTITKVRLDGRYIGDIRMDDADGRYYFQPNGATGHGEKFGTLADCKRSVEDDGDL